MFQMMFSETKMHLTRKLWGVEIRSLLAGWYEYDVLPSTFPSERPCLILLVIVYDITILHHLIAFINNSLIREIFMKWES